MRTYQPDTDVFSHLFTWCLPLAGVSVRVPCETDGTPKQSNWGAFNEGAHYQGAGSIRETNEGWRRLSTGGVLIKLRPVGAKGWGQLLEPRESYSCQRGFWGGTVAFIEEPKIEQSPGLVVCRKRAVERSAWSLFSCYILIPCRYFPLAESHQRWKAGSWCIAFQTSLLRPKTEWRRRRGGTGFLNLYVRLRQDFSTLALLTFWPANSLWADCPVPVGGFSSISGSTHQMSVVPPPSRQ